MAPLVLSCLSRPYTRGASACQNLLGRLSLSSASKIGKKRKKIAASKVGQKNRAKKDAMEVNEGPRDKISAGIGYETVNQRYVVGLKMEEMTLESFNNIVTDDPYMSKIEMIERAWAISKIKEMSQTRTRLVEYYRSIRRAMQELKKVDERLFIAASKPLGIGEEGFLYDRGLRPPVHPPDSSSGL